MNTQALNAIKIPAAPLVAAVAQGARHSYWSMAAHWSSAAAVLLAAGSALGREWVEDSVIRAQLMTVHQQAGLFVLLALAWRLGVRFSKGLQDHAGPMHPLMRWMAHLAHLALYAQLLLLPLLGLAVCSASAMHVSFFGLFQLPSVIQDDPDLAATLADGHVWAAWVMLALVAAHLAAALWHHLIRRDNVLAAMLPWVQRRPPKAHAATDAGPEAGQRSLQGGD